METIRSTTFARTPAIPKNNKDSTQFPFLCPAHRPFMHIHIHAHKPTQEDHERDCLLYRPTNQRLRRRRRRRMETRSRLKTEKYDITKLNIVFPSSAVLAQTAHARLHTHFHSFSLRAPSRIERRKRFGVLSHIGRLVVWERVRPTRKMQSAEGWKLFTE